MYHMWNCYLDADLDYSDLAKDFLRLMVIVRQLKLMIGMTQRYARPTPNCAWTEFDNRYNLAASNFFAETVDFSLEDEQVTTFISKPEKQFKPMVSGTTYFMDIVLNKTTI